MKAAQIEENRGREILLSLEKSEWVVLFNRLILFIGETYYGLLDDEELAIRAYLYVLEGRRKTWHEEYSVYENMRRIVTSLAWSEGQKLKRTIPMEGYGERTADATLPADTLEDSPAVVFEQKESLERVKGKLYQIAGDDQLRKDIVGYQIENPDAKPQDIAEALGVDVTRIYNAQKFFRRRKASVPNQSRENRRRARGNHVLRRKRNIGH
jgi:hypothetical protein